MERKQESIVNVALYSACESEKMHRRHSFQIIYAWNLECSCLVSRTKGGRFYTESSKPIFLHICRSDQNLLQKRRNI